MSDAAPGQWSTEEISEQVPAVIYMATDDESYTTVYTSPQISQLLDYSAEEWTRNPEAWGNSVHPMTGIASWRGSLR